MRMRWRRWAMWLAATVVLAALVTLGPIGYLHLATRDHRDGGEAPVALVFGAGLTPSGGLTPLLRDRVEAAVSLYRDGAVGALLMSGDNSRHDHDEVGAMAAYAGQRGVPPARIVTDHAGFDTYDSCYRAREIFGVRRAVVVTTGFHLARAVYTCRRLGIDASGVGTPDWSRYRDDTPGWQAREALAAAKALWELHVTRPEPTFLGPREEMPPPLG